MSYGLKYTITFREDSSNTANGNIYKINIYQSGYVASSSAMICSDNPISLSYKKQDLISPILGSELTIGIMSVSNGQYLEFATAAPLAYYLDILKSTDGGGTYVTYWSGVNTTDCYSEPYQSSPYPINLKFNCGMGELQWHRYENAGNLVGGLESLALTISNCLSFLPYSKNFREIINIREDYMSDALGFLEQTFLSDMGFTEIADDGELHGINCNKLLNQILTSLNCRMYQSNNMWWIERIYERTGITNANTTRYFDYTPNATFQNPGTTIASIATSAINLSETISNSTSPKLLEGGDWAVTQKKTGISYQFDSLQIANSELVTNPFFEDTPTTKDTNDMPLFWDVGSALSAYVGTSHMGLKNVNPYTNDPKYQTGLCFDSTVLSAFNSFVNTYETAHAIGSPANLNNLNMSYLGTTWALHAVRRPGDTFSNPWLYIDPINGSLQVDMRFFMSVKITPTGNQNTNTGGDCYKLWWGTAGFSMVIPILIRFTDAAGFKITQETMYLQVTTANNWVRQSSSTLASAIGPLHSMNDFNNQFPDPKFTGQATSLTLIQLYNILQAAHINSNAPVYFNFDTKYTFNIPFLTGAGGFGSVPDVFAFDLFVYPAMIYTNGRASTAYTSTGLVQNTISLDTFGINTMDIQYKDSFQGTTGYTKFYSAPDLNNRWSEQVVKPTFGDTMTPAYPGSFRLANAIPTVSWHVQGQSQPFLWDTGTSNADPGSGKMRFNSATLASATHLYVDNINELGTNVSSWEASFANGDKIVISDTTLGIQYVFTAGTIVSHTGYYDIPITYVSGSGSFVAGDLIEVARKGGQILADILFQNYAALIAVYRRAITGKIYQPGGIPFYYNIQDEDGTQYAQTGSMFDFKKAMLTVNLEEVSASQAVISNSFNSTNRKNIIASTQNTTITGGNSNISSKTNTNSVTTQLLQITNYAIG